MSGGNCTVWNDGDGSISESAKTDSLKSKRFQYLYIIPQQQFQLFFFVEARGLQRLLRIKRPHSMWYWHVYTSYVKYYNRKCSNRFLLTWCFREIRPNMQGYVAETVIELSCSCLVAFSFCSSFNDNLYIVGSTIMSFIGCKEGP